MTSTAANEHPDPPAADDRHDPVAASGHHGHGHGDQAQGHGHPDGEVHWNEMAAAIEREGDVLAAILDDTLAIIDDAARRGGLELRRIIDIGSGPGVGTTALARAFPTAEVIAVDGSEAMAERAGARIERLGLGDRVRTVTAELPGGLVALGHADLVWAAMVMHHLGDERAVLAAIRSVLDPGGLVVLLEFGDPFRFLPDGAEGTPPGLMDRIDAAAGDWIVEMRAALPDSVVSDDYPTMLAAAGFEVLVDQLVTTRVEGPLDDEARLVAVHNLARMQKLTGHALDAADRAAIDVLLDPDAPLGIRHRPDVDLDASRHVYVARATPGAGSHG